MDLQGKVYGGHLDEGWEVLTLAVFTVLKVAMTRLIRKKSTGALFPMLMEELVE
jgi:hypothetical protein